MSTSYVDLYTRLLDYLARHVADDFLQIVHHSCNLRKCKRQGTLLELEVELLRDIDLSEIFYSFESYIYRCFDKFTFSNAVEMICPAVHIVVVYRNDELAEYSFGDSSYLSITSDCKFCVYSVQDDCVNSTFDSFEAAVAWADTNQFDAVKLHTPRLNRPITMWVGD